MMGNKKTAVKGSKQKEVQAKRISRDWSYSNCSRKDLLNLVAEGGVQGQDVVQWCPSFRQPYAQENVDEIVMYKHFVERRLALPTYDFLHGLLYVYGLQLHHLNPNSIVHLAIFVYFCEAFLGIKPTTTFSDIFSGSSLNPATIISMWWGVSSSNSSR